jgi:predicted dehydrogenase
MSASPLRLGIAGCGLVVERGHLPALAGIDNVRVVAVADPAAERRRIATGARGYAALDEMLAAEELEAVLVCSPPALHLPHAVECAEAGVPALVEKPPAVTLPQAHELASLRPEPVIGFNRRFARGLPTGRRAVGDASRATAIFDAPPGDWDRGDVPADPLFDLGSHLVDLGCWITGANPARARAFAVPTGRVSFEIEMTDGLRLHADCGAATHYRELIEVRGEDGQVRTWRWPSQAPRWSPVERLRRHRSPLVESWRAQLQAFANYVRTGDPGRLALARQSIQVMAALEAVQASADGSWDWLTIPRPEQPSELGGSVPGRLGASSQRLRPASLRSPRP